MLFSEPKIPQSSTASPTPTASLFQCSSASRKFLNGRCSRSVAPLAAVSVLFSEPKIPQSLHRQQSVELAHEFQCSSASRKFLNYPCCIVAAAAAAPRFSALQRAENSSICVGFCDAHVYCGFQCSSASRKFLNVWTKPA